MTTTAAASSSTPTIQELNVGTSLDVSSIVSGLMQVQDIPLTELENQVTTEQAEVSAYGSLSSALSTFQSVVANAADSANFQTLTASVGSTSAASAAISTSTGTGAATQGSHSLSISQLAQNQLIASGDFSSTTAAVGTGTLTIQYGSYASNGSFTPSTTQASTSVTIGSGNSTVSGVVSAINSAAGGVTASVVNDGTGSRIVLSGNNTGASNGFRVVVSDSDGDNDDSSGLSALAYDPTDTSNTSGSALLQSSQDAKLSVDNIAVTSASNTVTNAVQGVTLSLTGTTTSATTLTVGSSASQASGVVEGFVNGYNTLVSAITSLTAYDATTNQASALTGDTTTQIISENLQSAAAATFNTGDPNYTDLADLGITFQADGTLALNSSKLSAALAADPNAVQQIFSTTGSATDSSVSYNGATSDTKAGTYALNVTQLATQGTLTGSAAAGLTITAGSNDTFSLDLDSTTAEISVPAGTYTAATLASAVQNAINTNSTISKAGLSVNVSNNNGVSDGDAFELRFGIVGHSRCECRCGQSVRQQLDVDRRPGRGGHHQRRSIDRQRPKRNRRDRYARSRAQHNHQWRQYRRTRQHQLQPGHRLTDGQPDYRLPRSHQWPNRQCHQRHPGDHHQSVGPGNAAQCAPCCGASQPRSRVHHHVRATGKNAVDQCLPGSPARCGRQ
jgi:flagellar hook-associated protein 2